MFPKHVDYERAAATTEENFVDWYSRVNEEIDPDSIDMRLVSNMDETMVNSSSERLKVVCPRDVVPVKAGPSDKADMHITVVLCIFATGAHTKPTLIFPLKEFPANCENDLNSFNFAGQESGWITSELFYKWVKDVYIPKVKAIRLEHGLPEDSWGVLYLDSHDSRRNPAALKLLKENHIHCVTIVAHASHVMQPLDVGVNGAFKQNLKKYKPRMKGQTMEIRRPLLLEAIRHALYNALYPGIIKEAFAKAGLYPFGVNAALGSPYTYPAGTEFDFINPNKKKRSGLKMDGKVITNENFIEELEKEAKKAKREATAAAKAPSKRKLPDTPGNKKIGRPSKKAKKESFVIRLGESDEEFDSDESVTK